MKDRFHINCYLSTLSHQGPVHDPKISLKYRVLSVIKTFGFMKIGHLTFIFCFIAFVTGFENLTFANSDNSGATTEKTKTQIMIEQHLA